MGMPPEPRPLTAFCTAVVLLVMVWNRWNGWSQPALPNGLMGKSMNAPTPNWVLATWLVMFGITVLVRLFCRFEISPPIDPVTSMLMNTSRAFTSVVKVRSLSCGPAGSL